MAPPVDPSVWAELEEQARLAARRSARGRPLPLRGPRGAALLARGGVFSGPELGGTDGVALSAERVALYAALMEGADRPTALLLRGGPRGGRDAGPPSAATLQVLAEFAPDLVIRWGTASRPLGGLPVHELLPGAFGPGHLPVRTTTSSEDS